MQTKGIEVHEGYLVFPLCQMVPPQFWDRLKHAATKAGMRADLAAEYVRENATVALERKMATWPSAQRTAEFEREQALFRRWVERVVGPQTLWPWERGWTPELVDSYLEPAQARAA